MVARIAKAHRGELVLKSELGKGLTAIILLPSIIDENVNDKGSS